MSKVLIMNSGLKHARKTMEPLIQRMNAHLSKNCDYVDLRTPEQFNAFTINEYDQIIFVFPIALDSIPSTTLEIFERVKKIQKKPIEIYTLIACDEYEPDKCLYASQVVRNWCDREGLNYKGSLHIGSSFVIMHTSGHRFVVSSRIKRFATAIINHKDFKEEVTLFTYQLFIKHANNYWKKEIKKKQKELKKA